MANVAKVAILYSVEDTEVPGGLDVAAGVITFHVQKSPGASAWSASDREELGRRVETWLRSLDNPPWAPAVDRSTTVFYPPEVYFRVLTVEAVLPEPSAQTVRNIIDYYGRGSGGATIEAPQLTCLIGLRTSVDSRRGRGRIFLPAFRFDPPWGRGTGYISEEQRNVLGEIGANLAYRIFPDPEASEPWVLCVFSRVDQTSHAVTHFAISDRFHTQRRRQVIPAIPYQFGLDAAPITP